MATDFGSAFKDYLKDDTAPAAPAEAEGTGTPEDSGASEEAGVEEETPLEATEGDEGRVDEGGEDEGTSTDGEDDDGESDSQSADPEPEAEAGETPATEGASDDILARLAGLLNKPAQQEPEQQQEPQQQEPQQQEPQGPTYTEDEQQILKDYEENYGEIAQGEALRRRGEYQILVGHIFSQVAEFLGPRLQMLDTIAQRTHLQDLSTSIEGYNDEMVDAVASWIDEQPAFLQSAYKQVMEQGSAEDVATLFGMYKQAKAPPAPKPARKVALPEPAKQAARSLAPVSSRRSSAADPVDPNDFSGSFAKLAADEKT